MFSNFRLQYSMRFQSFWFLISKVISMFVLSRVFVCLYGVWRLVNCWWLRHVFFMFWLMISCQVAYLCICYMCSKLFFCISVADWGFCILPNARKVKKIPQKGIISNQSKSCFIFNRLGKDLKIYFWANLKLSMQKWIPLNKKLYCFQI